MKKLPSRINVKYRRDTCDFETEMSKINLNKKLKDSRRRNKNKFRIDQPFLQQDPPDQID